MLSSKLCLELIFLFLTQISSMKKWILGLSSAWLLANSCQHEKENKSLEEEISIGQEWIANLATGTDSYQTDRIGDTTVYIYPDVSIKVVEKYDLPGEYIQLNFPKGVKEIDVEAAYYLGKIGKYLLIDVGTSSVRKIDIYDQETMEIVHSGVSYKSIHIDQQKVYYKTKIELSEEDKKPECSSELKDMGEEFLGYLQTVYFDLNTLEYQTTTQVECAYFE